MPINGIETAYKDRYTFEPLSQRAAPIQWYTLPLRFIAEENVYICPAGERLAHHFTNEEHGLVLHRYWTSSCQSCPIKPSCTTSKERRITRWEHEQVLEAVQRRLDEHPEKMRQRRETVEHPFGTIKARMGATHFLMKTLPRVAQCLHYLPPTLAILIRQVAPFETELTAS